MADEVDDLLYGNLDKAPLIDSLTSPRTEQRAPSPSVAPGTVKEEPLQAPGTTSVSAFPSMPPSISQNGEGNHVPRPLDSSIVSIVGGDYDAPPGNDARKGLRDPNISRAGKMFIGGLSWETTEDGLMTYMQVFGEIDDCMIMKDMTTGRSRGFGFLTFKDPASIDKVLENDHYIDGKKIDPKRAVPKEEYEKAQKCFVGGLPPEVTDAEFKDFFRAFGGVSDATIMHDRETGRSRGFGFVTFTSWDGVQKLLDKQAAEGIFIKDTRVEVKPAALRARVGGRGGGHVGRGDRGYGQPPPMSYPTVAAGGYGMYAYPQMGPDTGYYGAPTGYGYGGAPQQGYYPPAPQQGAYSGYADAYSRPSSGGGYYPDQGITQMGAAPVGLPLTGPVDAEAALAGAASTQDMSTRVGIPDYPPQDPFYRHDDRHSRDYDHGDSRRSDRRDRDYRDSRRSRDDYPRDGGSRQRGYGGGSGGGRRHPYSR